MLKNLPPLVVNVLGWICLTIVAPIVTISLSAQTADVDKIPAEVRFAAAGIATSRQKLSCAEASYSFRQLRSDDMLKWEQQRDVLINVPAYLRLTSRNLDQSSKTRWYKKESLQAFVDERVDATTKAVTSINRYVVNQQQAKFLQQINFGLGPDGQPQVRNIGVITRADDTVRKGIRNPASAEDPRVYVYFINGRPLDEYLLDAKTSAVYKGEEAVDGSKCIKIESRLSKNELSIFWIDSEHNFLLRQVERYNLSGEKPVLVTRTQIPRLLESSGTWFPASIETKIFWAAIAPARGVGAALLPPITVPLTEVAVTKRIEVSQFRTGCDIPDEVFNLEWPVGTRVHNDTTGKDFTVVAQELEGTPSQQAAATLPRVEDDPQAVIGAAKPTVEVGQLAPAFNAVDVNGKMWKPGDWKSKKNLLLTFFPKCFTGGCANHLSSLRDQQATFDASGTQILAVSADPAEGARGQKAFAEQWKLKFPLLPDTKRTLSLLFGAAQNDKQLAARMTFLIDKQGIVRYVDTDVDVQTHGSDMLAKIKELGLDK